MPSQVTLPLVQGQLLSTAVQLEEPEQVRVVPSQQNAVALQSLSGSLPSIHLDMPGSEPWVAPAGGTSTVIRQTEMQETKMKPTKRMSFSFRARSTFGR
jgi:hypothetical protein